MFHTTSWTLTIGLLGLFGGSPIGAQEKSEKTTQKPEVKEVIDNVIALEKTLKSVEIEMATIGAYPGGLKFRTSGRLRVLGTTHFHILVESTFVGSDDDELRSEVEKVITPDGVTTRQDGPIEVVYTQMTAALVKRLEVAQKALAAAEKASPGSVVVVPTILSDGGRAPLGSAMVTALAQLFDLSLQKDTRLVGGRQCKVLSGPWRVPTPVKDDKQPTEAQDATSERVGAHSAEIVVRPDGVPIAMRQFDDKHVVLLELRIDKLTLNPGLTAKDFSLAVPEGTVILDVMDHRPSRVQIQRLLDDYQALPESKGKESPIPDPKKK